MNILIHQLIFFRNLIWVLILFVPTNNVFAREYNFSASKLIESGIADNLDNGFAIPTVRLFNEKGRMVKELHGNDMFIIEEYQFNYSKSETKKNKEIIQKFNGKSNLKKITNYFNIRLSEKKPTLLYIDFNHYCSPCGKLRQKFKATIYNYISDKYNVIFLRSMD